MISNILFRLLILICMWILRLRSTIPATGIEAIQRERAMSLTRRCKPVNIIPNTEWKEFTRFLRSPSPAEIAFWTKKGEKAAWPCIRPLHVRMDAEIELNRELQ